MTLQSVMGTYEKVFARKWNDPAGTPDVYKKPQEARIYARCFAVYKVDERASDWQWSLDHVSTGCHFINCRRRKDCVAKIEALLQIDIDWSEADRDKLFELSKKRPDIVEAFREAIKMVAPDEPKPDPKLKPPAVYGTLASAFEQTNSYDHYSQAYRAIWERRSFHYIHYITKKEIEYQIRLDLVEELIDCYSSAKEAYEEIMNYESHILWFTKLGHPLNARACKALMRWAVTHS